MSGEKDIALVIRSVDFSETSNVVTLFTREFGQIHALAKGARRPKGPFESALDLLSICRVVFLRKSSETLDLLTEAKLERRFRGLGHDLSRIYAGYYVAELLYELTDVYDPHPKLFDAAERTLRRLSEPGPISTTVLRFELVTLQLLGHMPSLDQCVECGRDAKLGGRVHFSLLGGGVICPACRPGRRQVVSVRGKVLDAMARLADVSSSDWQPINLDQATSGELRGVLNRFLWNLLGKKPRLHEHLKLLVGQ